MPWGAFPTSMVFVTASVDVSITLMVEAPSLETYTFLPSSVAAMPCGVGTAILLSTVLVPVSSTATASSLNSPTYAFGPLEAYAAGTTDDDVGNRASHEAPARAAAAISAVVTRRVRAGRPELPESEDTASSANVMWTAVLLHRARSVRLGRPYHPYTETAVPDCAFPAQVA